MFNWTTSMAESKSFKSGRTPMKRVEEIEILRSFAILGVVALHALNLTLWLYNRSLFVSLQYYLKFAVPLFVLISGFVLGLKYRSDFSTIDFYKKRAKSIVPQYIIFSLIYMLYGYLSPDLFGIYVTPITLAEFPVKLLTGSASPHFWFFILIIQLYFLYPFLIRLIDNRFFKNNFLMFFLFVLLLKFGWEFFKSDISVLMSTDSAMIKRFTVSTFRVSLFSYLIYFVLGIYASDHVDIIKKEFNKQKYTYFFIGVILLFPLLKACKSYFHFNIPPSYSKIKNIFLTPLLCIFFYIFLYKLSMILVRRKNLLKKIMILIGEYSFGMFMIHFLVMLEIRRVFYAFNEAFYYEWELCLLYYIATILLSMGFLKLISLLPYSNFVVGINTGKKKVSLK